jgi:hypothetical protein
MRRTAEILLSTSSGVIRLLRLDQLSLRSGFPFLRLLIHFARGKPGKSVGVTQHYLQHFFQRARISGGSGSGGDGTNLLRGLSERCIVFFLFFSLA